MKKIIIAALSAMLLFSSLASAEKLGGNARLDEPIGTFYPAFVSETERYLVNSEHEILSGPFVEVSDFDGFAYCTRADGSNVLFDLDGSVICDLSANDSPVPPENGIYAIERNVPFGEEWNETAVFEIYDYATRELLCSLDRFIFYYLEQQTDKMVIENDEGKLAFIDKYGNLQSGYVYDEVKKRFNPDYFPYPKAYAIVVQDGVEKYIDWDYNEIDLDNYNGEPFITNCSYPQNENRDKNTDFYIMESVDKTGLYDIAKGCYTIPLQDEFKLSSVYDNTYVSAITKDGESIGIVDMKCNWLVEPIYSYIEYCGQGSFLYSIRKPDEHEKFGIIKGGKSVFESRKNIYKVLDNGLIAVLFPDPNQNRDYPHNYTDYVFDVVNYAGHSMTGDSFTEIKYTDSILYTSKAYHVSNPQMEPFDIAHDFAVINLNGKYLDFDGVIRNGRTLVPMREKVEGLGGTVEWNGEEKSVHALIEGKTIELKINSDVITVDGEEIKLDVGAQLINDKTMLPLRALAETVGIQVS